MPTTVGCATESVAASAGAPSVVSTSAEAAGMLQRARRPIRLNNVEPPKRNGESAGSIHAPGTVNRREGAGKHFYMNDLVSFVFISHGTGSEPFGGDGRRRDRTDAGARTSDTVTTGRPGCPRRRT